MINSNTAFIRYILMVVLISTCSSVGAARYILPPGDVDVIGSVTRYEVEPGTIPIDIATRRGVGQDEFLSANPQLKRWIPVSATEYKRVILPTRYILPAVERSGIVVNVAEKRMYYYLQPEKSTQKATVITYPVSIGQADWQTPITSAIVVRKKKHPSWYPPISIKLEAAQNGVILPDVVEAGPDNPLGQYAIYLDIPGYLIHGTSNPNGIGMRVTHGCIRMYPKDIRALFSNLPLGTPVNIINEPVKVGWHAGKLYIEVHAPLSELNVTNDQLSKYAIDLVESALFNRSLNTVLIRKIRQIVKNHSGLPIALDITFDDRF